MPKRICFVVEYYYPSTSGVPVVTKYLAEGLVKYNYHVDILTSGYINNKKMPEEDSYNGVNIFRYYIWNSPLYFIKEETGEKERFLKKILSSEYDCIIITCTQCWSTNFLLKYLDRIKYKKILYTHGYSGLKYNIIFNSGAKHFIGSIYHYLFMKSYYLFLPHFLKAFSRVVFISNDNNAKIFHDKHRLNNGIVIDNAVDDVFFEKTESSKNNTIICISNYSRGKNQEFLLKAFYMAQTKDYSLVLIGSKRNDYYERLIKIREDLENEYGHKDTLFLYDINRELIPEHLKKASIFIMSSRSEEYSIALCEAMASSVPFISTNVGNASLLPGGVIADSIEEMSEAITNLIHSDSLRDRLGKEGLEYALIHNKRSEAIRKLVSVIEEDDHASHSNHSHS